MKVRRIGKEENEEAWYKNCQNRMIIFNKYNNLALINSDKILRDASI